MDTIKCNAAIEMFMSQGNLALGKKFGSDVIFLKAPMQPPVDDAVKHEIEEVRQIKPRRGEKKTDKLTVFVETPGGYVETVERIVSVFRKHYTTVEYVVPNYAYSAGTILVLSGDELYMDYYSVLGPIDPQIDMEGGGGPVSGMAYLAKFEELLKKINDPNQVTDGELQYLINRFDPGKLFTIEQAIEHSRSLLKAWLPAYKFKSWLVKQSSGEPVTDKDRESRADHIAKVLGDATRWHSHGRGVGIKELESEEIKLKVVNFGADDSLNRNISQYYGLFVDYLGKNGIEGALHSRRGVRRLA
jgi:hypothetical protein